jgi:hypothetical protein
VRCIDCVGGKYPNLDNGLYMYNGASYCREHLIKRRKGARVAMWLIPVLFLIVYVVVFVVLLASD